MKTLYLILLSVLCTGSLFAQEKIKTTSTPPEIDGFIDEVWEQSRVYPIDKPFKKETPTVTATWQALSDYDNFYVLVNVEDDDHWPGWEANDDSWRYDLPEIYWDVNEVLDDGLGAADGKGHYQFADGFIDSLYNKPITKKSSFNYPGGTYAYTLAGEGYVYELAVPLANLIDESGVAISTHECRNIGFDVTIVDQDEGLTTARQRYVWSNDGDPHHGSIDESWNNMDGAGVITLHYCDPCFCDPYLSFSSEHVVLGYSAGSSDSVYVSGDANASWGAETNTSWLTITPTTNTGSGYLKVTASENSGGRRSAKVLFDYFYKKQFYFTVIQLAKGEVGFSSPKIPQLALYPNPTKDQFTIQGGIDRVELFNNLGVLVKEATVNGKTISVAEFPNGVYMVKAYKNGQFEGVAKVIKN
jgi:hypothetical protein